MTQATDSDVLSRLDRLATAVEVINQSVQALTVEVRVSQAQTSEKLAAMDQRLSDMEKRIDQRFTDMERLMDQRFAQVDQRFAQVDQRFAQVDGRLDRIEKQVNAQDGRVWGILVALFTVIAGVAAKLAFFPNWPGPAA